MWRGECEFGSRMGVLDEKAPLEILSSPSLCIMPGLALLNVEVSCHAPDCQGPFHLLHRVSSLRCHRYACRGGYHLMISCHDARFLFQAHHHRHGYRLLLQPILLH